MYKFKVVQASLFLLTVYVSRHHRKWRVSNIGIGSDSEVLLLVEAIALSKLQEFQLIKLTTFLATAHA